MQNNPGTLQMTLWLTGVGQPHQVVCLLLLQVLLVLLLSLLNFSLHCRRHKMSTNDLHAWSPTQQLPPAA